MSALILNALLLLLIPSSLSTFDSSILNDKQSESSLSDIGQKKIDEEHVIFDDKKTSKEGSAAYNMEKSRFNLQKQDNRSYSDQDTALKEYDKGRHRLGESEAVDQGKNSYEQHGGGYYKKGHHRTGFSNNYHKDESGNNSSFYEDSDDERGHRSSENNGGYYGQKSQDSFKDGVRDASYNERDRQRQGVFGNRENYDNYHDYSGGHNNNRYNDDRRNYLQDEVGRYYDRNGKRIYYHGGQFYPVIRRNKDYVQSFGYPRYYVDTLSRSYYKEDPYSIPHSRDYRYFPSRENYYERESYYPNRGYYDSDFRDDIYGNKYISKYRRGFDNGVRSIG